MSEAAKRVRGLSGAGRQRQAKRKTPFPPILVEIRVGDLGLVEPIAVREQRIDIGSALDDEIGASLLIPYRHAPGRHDRDLLAEQRSHVERDLGAQADERRRSPGFDYLQGLLCRCRGA